MEGDQSGFVVWLALTLVIVLFVITRSLSRPARAVVLGVAVAIATIWFLPWACPEALQPRRYCVAPVPARVAVAVVVGAATLLYLGATHKDE